MHSISWLYTVFDLPAGEYAEIGIYDKRYQAITDNIDFTGLGILDYKKLCLKDRL